MASQLDDTGVFRWYSRTLPPEVIDPISARVKFEYGAFTHPGKVRENNEDSYLVYRCGRFWEPLKTNLPPGDLPRYYEEDAYVLAVADGMGGAAAGEVASTTALEVGVELILRAVRWALRLDLPESRDRAIEEVQQRGREIFQRINEAIVEQAKADPALSGMGTTLTVAQSVGTELFIGHIGDSRAYLFRGGQLKQLTHDHTFAQMLVDLGELTSEEALNHPRRNVLMRVIGGRGTDKIRAEIKHLRLQDGDWLMLCSDGLTDLVKDEEIATALQRAANPQVACEAMAEVALERGGNDNITVVAARYQIPAG